MFKGLRDRLKGVSEKLEEELDFELEKQLEEELQASLAKEAPAAPAEQASTAEAPAEQASTAEAPTEPAPGAESEPVTTEAPPEPAPDTPSQPTPDPSTPDTDPADAPGQTPPTATASEEPASTESPAHEAQESIPEPMPPASTPTTAPSTAPTSPAPPATQEKPATQDKSATQDMPAQDKPAQKYGRKYLSEQEIEERLRRELEAAVETQKDVETVVRSSGQKPVARYTINEDVLEDILWELEVGLLESDVALPVIEAIKENVKEQLLSMSVSGKNPTEIVEKVLRSAIRRVLNVNPIDFDQFVRDKLASGKKPVVVMFVGVNGTGKTTSIARLAYRLKEQGLSPVMAAGDTFRAGAIEQLTQHADKLGVKIIKHSAGADPAAVAYDAVEHAKARYKDVVLLDTAGRMQTNSNLMDEMDKIRRVANPDLVIFVGDSLAGNDAVEQARKFDEVVDIDGAILTKTDVDAKGGAALSVAFTINKPLLFVGVGQDYPDLRPFDAQWMVDRLFGEEAEA